MSDPIYSIATLRNIRGGLPSCLISENDFT
jgi:hypothetical protein